MLDSVKLLDEMSEQMWLLLQRNLSGITENEADWRPHADANNVRWLLGHLAWFEAWTHDALRREGRYLIDRDPTAYLEGTVPELLDRFTRARIRLRARVEKLDHREIGERLSYFGRYEVTGLELLKTHALHLAGHRFQIRYVRGTYARAHGTDKARFDPW